MLFHLAGEYITAELALHSGPDVLISPMKQVGHLLPSAVRDKLELSDFELLSDMNFNGG